MSRTTIEDIIERSTKQDVDKFDLQTSRKNISIYPLSNEGSSEQKAAIGLTATTSQAIAQAWFTPFSWKQLWQRENRL